MLVSAPWPLFNRPSIQLGALKAYLAHYLPELEVQTGHFYLKAAVAVGYEVYQAVSERTWLAESVYAAMLYPQRKARIEKLFQKYAAGNSRLKKVNFTGLVADLKQATDTMIAMVRWESFDLAGFSMSLCQLTATLYCLKQVKRACPGLATVVGGTSFSKSSAREFLRSFPDIDYIVTGEGERPLTRLAQRLCRHPAAGSPDAIPGLTERASSEKEGSGLSQLDDLKTLPPPDYDDYFQILNSFAPEKRFFPTLPMELSRGCWWKRTAARSGVNGCAFCNLNLQWQGYRTKERRQFVEEIDYLSSRHQVLSVALADNALPFKKTERLFRDLGRLGRDFKFFSEIRATTSLKTLTAMRAAGMTDLQVGIESLSSSLLKKMNKGVSAVQNLEIMKNCEALGIKNTANLILRFPGSDESDVAQTLSAMEYAMVYRPLRPVRFWLGLESPVWRMPQAFGIKSVHNHPHYRTLFPENISASCRFMVQAFRGGLMLQAKLWRPVMRRIRLWKKQYAALQRYPLNGPILGYRDGGSFVMIHHRQYRSETIQRRLTGPSARIYLFCRKPRAVKRILAAFPEISEDRLMPFLRMMKARRLMFEDGGKYLSLAVPLR